MHWFWRAVISGFGSFIVLVLGLRFGSGFIMHWIFVAKWAIPSLTFPNSAFWFYELNGILMLAILFVPAFACGLLLHARLPHQTDHETRCRKCGYILRGISEPRCPECGERI